MENTKFGPKHVYVAFLDILGFSEAVAKNAPSSIQSMFGAVEMFAEDNEFSQERNMKEVFKALEMFKDGNDRVFEEFKEVKIDALSVSDSIYLWTSNDSALSFHQLVHTVCRYLTQFMLMGYPARAGISSGVVSKEPVKVGLVSQINAFGVGLVKAHSLEKKQEWSGAVIDERTIFEVQMKQFGDIFLEALLRDRYIAYYDVPIKGGQEGFMTVNWTRHLKKNEFGKGASEIRSCFADNNKSIDDPSVIAKIENTAKYFLDMKKPQKKEVTS